MARYWVLVLLFSPLLTPAQDLATLKDQKPVTFTGSLSAQYTFYSSTGPEYLKPGSWMISGSPVVTIYGVAIPFNFLISEKERSFRQPFNHFGLSPRYKWATLHLGYRSVNFSDYSLNGHQMLGAGAEITDLKKINFGVMYGRLVREVQPRQPDQFTEHQTPAFTRKGVALKGGYGDEKNNGTLFFMTASDDEKSITNIPDTLDLHPATNRVMGVRTHQLFLKNFSFDAEFASSETNTATGNSEIDITEKGTALDAKAGYANDRYRLMVKYLRIAPGFESFGKYFFQRDVRNITVDPGIDFFQKKLSIDLSFGFQRDHLDNNKAYKTERQIISGRLSARPWNFYMLNITAGNYSVDQQRGLYDPDPQLRVSQANFNITVMNNISIARKRFAHNFNLMYASQRLSDSNPTTSQYSEFDMNTWSAMYSATMLKIFLTGTFSYMNTAYNQKLTDSRSSGPLLILSKTFLKNYSTSVSWSDRTTHRDHKKSHHTSTIGFSADARFLKKHRVTFRYTYNAQSSYVEGGKSYNEKRGDLSYAFQF